MEEGLLDATLKMYHNASGNRHSTAADVCNEFSRLVIDKPLVHGSPIGGKVATRGHILENELYEENIEALLAEV
jgi:hypothetical protein